MQWGGMDHMFQTAGIKMFVCASHAKVRQRSVCFGVSLTNPSLVRLCNEYSTKECATRVNLLMDKLIRSTQLGPNGAAKMQKRLEWQEDLLLIFQGLIPQKSLAKG